MTSAKKHRMKKMNKTEQMSVREWQIFGRNVRSKNEKLKSKRIQKQDMTGAKKQNMTSAKFRLRGVI